MNLDRHLRLLTLLVFLASMSLVIIGFSRSELIQFNFFDDGEGLIAIGAGYALLSLFLGLFSREIAASVRKIIRRPSIVIISNHEFYQLIHDLQKELESRRISVWNDLDDLTPGDAIFPTINARIKDADAMVIFFGKDAVPYAETIIGAALSSKAKIIPVINEVDELPDQLLGLIPIFYDGNDCTSLADELERALRSSGELRYPENESLDQDNTP